MEASSSADDNLMEHGTPWAMVTVAKEDKQDLRNFYLDIADQVYIYAMAIISVVGLVGNCLTLAVMNRPSLRNSPVSVILSALAMSDSLVIITNMMNTWLVKAFNVSLIGSSDAICVFFRLFHSINFTYSSWLVVAVSVQRLLVILFPIKAKVINRPKYIRILVIIIAIIIFGAYFYKLWAWEIDENGVCHMTKAFAHFESSVGIWMEGALYAYMPILVLVITNGLIIYKLSQAASQRAEMTGVSSSAEQMEHKISKMVVAICTVFILLTAPVSLYYIILHWYGQFMYESPKMAIIESVITLIGILNFVINFFLYTLMSDGFRAELKFLFGFKATESRGQIETSATKSTST